MLVCRVKKELNYYELINQQAFIDTAYGLPIKRYYKVYLCFFNHFFLIATRKHKQIYVNLHYTSIITIKNTDM